MSPSNQPPCFNIILINHSAPHVEIPREFVKKHLKNKIPKDPIIRSANGGYSWNLKIKKIGENYCFTHGWNNVVKDINLGFGVFLYFLLVDQSTFIMSVYGLDGCEKILPQKINIDVDDDDDVEDGDDDVVDGCDDVEDGCDDVEMEDDDVDDEDNESDDDDEEDEFDDDDDVEDEDDDVEDGDDGVEEEDDDVEDDDEDDIDADIDGDDGDPFFTITITRTHKNVLRLKPVFLGLAGIDNERPITIKNSDGEEWPMELRMDKMYKRWHLTSGWFAFARNNNLSEGDKCVFKFITSEDILCLVKVTKKRSVTQPPPPRPRRETPAKEVEIESDDVDLESEDEGAKVVKRSRGRPPKRR